MLANKFTIKSEYMKKMKITTSKNHGAFGSSLFGIKAKRKNGFYYGEAIFEINMSNRYDTIQKSHDKHIIEYKYRGSKLANVHDASTLTNLHEYGHQIDNAYLYLHDKDVRDLLDEYSTPKIITSNIEINRINSVHSKINSGSGLMSSVIYQRLQNYFGLSYSNMKKRISDEYGIYADKSNKEFFAEAFTNMVSLKKEEKSEFMLKFEEFFDEEFQKIKE